MKPQKTKKPTKPKIVKTEIQLAQEQADRMLRDMNRLQATSNMATANKEKRSSVDIWKDSDFFFSVVFQSAAQKYLFLEHLSKKFNLGIDDAKSGDSMIQVINGIKFAEKIGLKINSEKNGKYPYPNLELAEMSLDGEQF